MKGRVTSIFVGLFMVLVFGCKGNGDSQEASSSKAPKSMSYAIEISYEGGKASQFEYYKDGDKESFIVKEKAGKGFTTSAWMLKDGATSYMINPEGRMAMKFEGDNNPMMGSSFPYMQMMVEPDWLSHSKEVEKQSGVSINEKGKKDVRGKKCKVMEIDDKKTGQKILYYISDDNVVRRWEHSPGGAFPQKTTMDLLKYEVDKKVPADKLSVPSGYQIQDMSQMMKMPNVPK